MCLVLFEVWFQVILINDLQSLFQLWVIERCNLVWGLVKGCVCLTFSTEAWLKCSQNSQSYYFNTPIVHWPCCHLVVVHARSEVHLSAKILADLRILVGGLHRSFSTRQWSTSPQLCPCRNLRRQPHGRHRSGSPLEASLLRVHIQPLRPVHRLLGKVVLHPSSK